MVGQSSPIRQNHGNINCIFLTFLLMHFPRTAYFMNFVKEGARYKSIYCTLVKVLQIAFVQILFLAHAVCDPEKKNQYHVMHWLG